MRKTFVLFVALALALSVAGLASAQEKVVEAQTIGRYGGILFGSGISDPRTFNPLVAQETSSTDLFPFIFDGLTEVNGVTTEVEPALAESWEFDETGTVWTFHLRKGVKWHDGEDFTAEDVIFTLDLIYDESIPTSTRDVLQVNGQPLGYRMVDEYTVELTLPAPFAPLLRQLTFEILPKHRLEQAWKEGRFNETWGVNANPRDIVGTGPFRIAEFRPSERVVFERNPEFWKVDAEGNRLPYLDRVVRVIVPNLETQRLKFETGEIDYYGITPADYEDMKEGEVAGNYTLYNGGPTFSTQFIVFNQHPDFVAEPKLSWFRNLTFRQALAHAVDKQTIIDQVYAGHAFPQWSPESTPNRAFLNENVRQYPYDLNRAAQLLAEAGFVKGNDGVLRDPNGNPVEFHLSTNSGNTERESIGNLFVDDLAQLGIRVNFQPIAFNTLVNQLLSGEEWEAIIIGLTGGVEPHNGRNVWHTTGDLHMWHVGQETPATDWEARVNEIFDIGPTILDHEERVKLYQEYQAIIAEQVPLIYTVAPASIAAIRNTIQNVDFTAFGGVTHNVEVLWKQ